MELGKRIGSARVLGCNLNRVIREGFAQRGHMSKDLNKVRERANHVMSREEHPSREDRDTNPEAGTHLGVFKFQEGGWLECSDKAGNSR